MPRKNIRPLLGRPLISYAIEAALSASCFDRVFVNTESDELGAIAVETGAEFYKRSDELAGDNAANEDFVYDFLKNVRAEYLFMVNPTSPLITREDIRSFVEYMLSGGYDSLFSVRQVCAQSFIGGKPLNFDPDAPHISSQKLTPVEYICWAITGWKSRTFIETYEEKGYAAYCGRIGTYPLSGFSCLDIDYEEDFQLAEAMMRFKMEKENATGIRRIV